MVEQANFDALCSLLAAWSAIEGRQRRQLLDSLCSSLTCLNAWTDKLLAQPAEAQEPEALRQHRSAFKAYLFFLAWASALAGREAREGATAAAQAAAASQATSQRGGRKKKAAADAVGWEWEAMHPKLVKAAAAALATDLWALFRPGRPEQTLMVRVTQLVGGGAAGPGAPGSWRARQRSAAGPETGGGMMAGWRQVAGGSRGKTGCCRAAAAGGSWRSSSASPVPLPPQPPSRTYIHAPVQAVDALESPAAAKDADLAGQAAAVLSAVALKCVGLRGRRPPNHSKCTASTIVLPTPPTHTHEHKHTRAGMASWRV